MTMFERNQHDIMVGLVRDCIKIVEKDRIEELEAKLAKAVDALEGVRAFVRDLGLYADQGHTLVPELEKACTTLAAVSETHKLKGETNGQ